MAEQYFYIRLIPLRPTFASDMSVDERALIQQHVAARAKEQG
jgi:hypothetical protein